MKKRMMLAVGLSLVSFTMVLRGGQIHLAAEKGDIDRVKALLDAHPDLLDARDEYGHAPLYFAAGAGRKKMIELLLARGADVNAKGNAGETPLFAAIDAGQFEAFTLLLAKGADPAVRSKYGATPTSLARIHNDSAMVRVLEKAQTPPREDNIFRACEDGNVSKVKTFLSQNSHAVGMTNEFGHTPLHIILQKLLLGKALSDQPDTKRQLLETNLNEIAALLLKNGADVNARNSEGRTPLHYAVLAGEKDLVVALLRADGNPNVKDMGGATPLHLATMVSSLEIVKLLVAKGADVNARDYRLWTPMRYAQEARKTLVSLTGTGGERDAVLAFLRESGGRE